jgi:glycosyltransferase involved in cell wall biosynthesis
MAGFGPLSEHKRLKHGQAGSAVRVQGRRGPTPAPTRVLFAKDRLHDTGGTLYLLETLPRMDPTRVTPLLIAFSGWDPIARCFESIGIDPIFLGYGRWDPRCLRDILAFIRRHRIDLVHLDGTPKFLFGRLGAKLSRLPTIAHFHSMLPMPKGRAFLNRQPILATSKSIAVSAAVRRWAIDELAIAPERIDVLYNGHDVERYASPSADASLRIRGEFALGDDTPVIGLIGRLDVAQKGQDVMIRAMSAVRTHRPDAVLLLVGDGPDRARCEALVHHLGLDGAVRFAGHRSDIADILAALDVAVVPSVCDEGLPFVAIEATAAGRPVVASNSGGLPEIVLHDQTGIIVSKGDVGGLAAAVTRVLDDPGLAVRLGEGGRRHASRFSLARHVDELMDMYEAVLDEHRRSKGRSSRPFREKPTC